MTDHVQDAVAGAIASRRECYRKIEAHRSGRPLIVYATSTRIGVPGMMAADVVREFVDQIDALRGQASVDILIHSTGGDPLTAWKLMSMLRERFDSISVLVPFTAFSAATLFALGADEIVMHPHASLGPIDPQVSIQTPDGNRRQFSYEDVGAFLRFLIEEVKITEQVHTSTIIDRLFSAVDPLNVGGAKRASELSTSVGERLLLTHMTSGDDKKAARQIAENLNKSFFAHGDAVSRSRARELRLKIAPNDPVLEGLLWDAYLGLEKYMELRRPFIPLQHYLSDPKAAASLAPTGPLALPSNAPAQVVQTVWQTVMQQALQSIAPATDVDYSVLNAVIESVHAASEYRTSGKLTGRRAPTGDIHLNAVDLSTGWHPVPAQDSPCK